MDLLSIKPHKTILLIEDDEKILKVHKIFLEKMRFAVDVAVTGQEALTKFKARHYLLVILDGGLPDMLGNYLGKRLREIEKSEGRARTPMVFLSGYPEEEIKKWCIDADIDAYGVKPIHPVLFESLVMQQLDR